MGLEDDIAQSREYEMQTYLRSMKAMYENAVAQNGEIYDTAFDLTHGFSRIDEAAILDDSRIIKVLRYAVAPTVSQMKLGQFLGLRSIGKFENDRIPKGTKKHKDLATFAGRIAGFATANLDKTRFM